MLVASTMRHTLTGAQSGIWYAQQLDPSNPMYNTGEYVEINGAIDPVTFEKALRKVIQEAETLHVLFQEDGDGPWQVIESKLISGLFTYRDVSQQTAPMQSGAGVDG